MNQPTIITANIKTYLAHLGIVRFLIAGSIVAMYCYANPSYGALMATAVVLVLAGVFYHVARRKVAITERDITARGGLLPKKTIQCASLKGVYVPTYVEPNFGQFQRLLLRDEQTGAKISLNGLYWGDEAVAAAYQALPAKQVAKQKEQLASVHIAKQFPEYLSYGERHPYKTAGMIVAGIVVAVTVVVALLYIL